MRTRIAVLAATVAATLMTAGDAAANDWAWPLRGEVITGYTNDNSKPYAGGMHRGIDIAAAPGTSVVAARSGTVSYAGNLGSSGQTVAITSSDGVHAASYLHLSSISVKRGDSITAGAAIGTSGTSGSPSSSQPHLHLGVRLADREDFYLDPLALLPPPGGTSKAAAAPAVGVPATARAQEAPVPTGGRVRSSAPAVVREPIAAPSPSPVPAAVRRRAPLAQPERPTAASPSFPGARRAPAEVPALTQPLLEFSPAPLARQPVTRTLPQTFAPGRGLPIGQVALGSGALLVALALLSGAAGAREGRAAARKDRSRQRPARQGKSRPAFEPSS